MNNESPGGARAQDQLRSGDHYPDPSHTTEQ